jgi:hypothetical protein
MSATAGRTIQTSTIDQLREQLASQRERLAAQRRDIEERRAALAEESKALVAQEKLLEAKEEVLAQLLALSPEPAVAVQVHRPETGNVGATGAHGDLGSNGRRKLLTPKAAVLELLKTSGPMTQKAIVDQLEDAVQEGSLPARKALTNSIWWLRKNGEVSQMDDGRLALGAFEQLRLPATDADSDDEEEDQEERPTQGVSTLVLEYIRRNPGHTSPELGDHLQGPLASLQVRQPRKAVFRTLFTLKNRQKLVRTDAAGRYFTLG